MSLRHRGIKPSGMESEDESGEDEYGSGDRKCHNMVTRVTAGQREHLKGKGEGIHEWG
jgi:hypothetical protein